MLARELRDHILVVVQVPNVDVVARGDRQNVAVEHEPSALLHETGQRRAPSADKIAQFGESARAVIRLFLMSFATQGRICLDFALDAQPPRTARLWIRGCGLLPRTTASRATASRSGRSA